MSGPYVLVGKGVIHANFEKITDRVNLFPTTSSAVCYRLQDTRSMILTVHVRPNAKRNEIVSWLDSTTVKIKIAAPAQDGKANKALILFIAETLDISQNRISLIRGATTKIKQLVIPDEIMTNYVRKPMQLTML